MKPTYQPARVKYPTRATLWRRLQRGVEVLEDNAALERTLMDSEAAAQIAVLDGMIEDAKFLRKVLRPRAARDAETERKTEEFRRSEAGRKAALAATGETIAERAERLRLSFEKRRVCFSNESGDTNTGAAP